jgi:tetratricopeptide (TPR) repeat protein
VNGVDGQVAGLRKALALITSARPLEALPLLAGIPDDSGLHPHALHLRGIAHATSGRTAEAIDAFEQALPWLADSDELLANLARAYFENARYADALTLLDKLAAMGRASAATFSDRAAVLEKLEKDALALESYDAALALDASQAPAWVRKGSLLHKMERFDEALACLDRAICMQPDNALARSCRGSTLDKLGRTAEGLIEHERARALDPGQAAIWCGQGVCLVMMDRLEEGLDCFDQALAINPSHLQAMINRASVLAELCRYPESLSQFGAAMPWTPAGSKVRAQALTFRGMVELTLGKPAGWAGYEHRLREDRDVPRHNAAAARWSGIEPLAGKRILLWGEQGYGDVIQFCRYAASLVELGAKVILEVPQALSTLCASLPAQAVYPSGASLPPHDFQIPMMSMPLALQARPQLVQIPGPQGYLQVEPRFVEKWKQSMPPRTRMPRLGIACSGAPGHARNARRCIPLEKLAPLTAVAELVILQPRLTPRDSAVAVAARNIIQPSLDTGDFTDIAGLIANLDLVISVDTSIAHLAGAMGAPVWILLPWNAEWRWMTDRADTPWYASARLFRQPARSDWDAVVRDVLRALMT